MDQALPLAGLRLLLLEDDAELREVILAPALSGLGLEAVSVGNVAEARSALAAADFHLAVLDVHLPDGNGFAVAHELRRKHPQMGVIMLTRHSQPAWQVAGYKAGADIYLPKPVQVEVLCAAVESLAGRLFLGFSSEPQPPWQLLEAGWKLQAPSGQQVALNEGERLLLERLFAEPGTVVARDALLAELGELDGSGAPADAHRLDMLVYRLRRKLDAARLPALPLRTVRGRGYVLAKEARCEAGDQPASLPGGQEAAG